MNSIFRVEAQLGLVYKWYIKDDYDIEVAFLEFVATKIMAASTNKNAKKIAWIHCDFSVAIANKGPFQKKVASQYKCFDKVVCVSEKSRNSYVSLFGNKPEAVVIHNVIDEEEIISKANVPLPALFKERGHTNSDGKYDHEKKVVTILTVAPASKNRLALLIPTEPAPTIKTVLSFISRNNDVTLIL